MKFVKIPSGSFKMISDKNPRVVQTFEDTEVDLQFTEFEITDTPVTNADFKRFVAETGYVTESERIGSSFVFWKLVDPQDEDKAESLVTLPWWKVVKGADWRHPFGQHSSIAKMDDYPVTHVSRNDALAYCEWSGTRLPSEAEWEYAARGGNFEDNRPWGSYLHKGEKYFANYWQGNSKPHSISEAYKYDSIADGYLGVAPTHAFAPNNYGLYQVIGNVWEWCSNKLNVSITYFGKNSGIEIWQNNLSQSTQTYAFKGGCFLCKAPRVDLRDGTSADTGSCSVGFRVIKI